MARSWLRCRSCGERLGCVSQDQPLRLAAGAVIVFVDRDADQVTVRCPSCGARISVRARRIACSS